MLGYIMMRVMIRIPHIIGPRVQAFGMLESCGVENGIMSPSRSRQSEESWKGFRVVLNTQ